MTNEKMPPPDKPSLIWLSTTINHMKLSVLCEILVQVVLLVAIVTCVLRRENVLLGLMVTILTFHVLQVSLCVRFDKRWQHVLILFFEAGIAALAIRT